MTPRSKLFLLGFVLILIFVNSQIAIKEKQLAEGSPVILKLAPVDPRSLMQGDYMILSYELAQQAPKDQDSGFLYLKCDKRGLVGSFSLRPEAGTVPLRYRHHQGRAVFGIESYLFQEGMREIYQEAKYSELRVTKDGVPHLIRLLDEKFRPLGENEKPTKP